MIKLIKQGTYVLAQTQGDTKVLALDDKTFAWPYAGGIGEILVASRRKQINDHVLAAGKYRLVDVISEPKLTDLVHLELSVGSGGWQGYLLPTGLPTAKKIRSRIIPTNELVLHKAS